MPRTRLPDHRHSSDEALLAALVSQEPLALAEAYYRTAAAAHACAHRLVGPPEVVEGVLLEVYRNLWRAPPTDAPLEGWVRARCFAVGTALLREAQLGPWAPSLAELLPDLPPRRGHFINVSERAVAQLHDRERRALLLAHDRGIPTGYQEDPESGAALERALATLAADDDSRPPKPPPECADLPLADWVLGLLAPADVDAVAEEATTAPCAPWAATLRRGRRRLEGLPPTPDIGQRVLAAVLTGVEPVPTSPPVGTTTGQTAPAGAAAAPSASLTSALDAADLDVPTPAEPDEPAEPGGPDEPAEPGGPDEPAADAHAVDLESDAEAEPWAEADIDEAETAADLTVIDLPDDEWAEEEAGRGGGRRVLWWVVGLLLLLVGVAAGLYVGWLIVS